MRSSWEYHLDAMMVKEGLSGFLPIVITSSITNEIGKKGQAVRSAYITVEALAAYAASIPPLSSASIF